MNRETATGQGARKRLAQLSSTVRFAEVVLFKVKGMRQILMVSDRDVHILVGYGTLFHVLLLFIPLSTMFSQSRLLVTITATSHSTPSTRSNIFGVHQDATYCIDGELDPDLVESTYPDIGPPFDIYWIDHRLPTGCDSFPQINNIQEAGKRDTFMLYLLATIVHYPITLQWTHVEIGWSSLVLMDLSPESATEIDMLTDTVITLFGSTSRRLQIIGESTVLDADKYEQNPRSEYILFQNYPNPFNPKTTITYEIPQSAYVSLIVYDQAGSEVRRLFSGYQRSGLHTLEFDAADLASGVYICTVRHGSSERSIKLMVLK